MRAGLVSNPNILHAKGFSKSTGIRQAVAEVLRYSRALAALAGDPQLPPGMGPVSIYGGRLDADGKRRDLRDLYRCATRVPGARPAVVAVVRMNRSPAACTG